MKSAITYLYVSIIGFAFVLSTGGYSLYKHTCETCNISYVYVVDHDHSHKHQCSSETKHCCSNTSSEIQDECIYDEQNCCSDFEYFFKLDQPFTPKYSDFQLNVPVCFLSAINYFDIYAVNSIYKNGQNLYKSPPEQSCKFLKLSVLRV